MNRSQVRRQFTRRLSRKANVLNGLRVQLGDMNGHLYPDYAADPNLVYYRRADQVHSVKNVIAPPILDLWVRIGVDPLDGQFQVLKVDGLQGGGTVVQVAGYPPSSRYSWGGQDPVLISLRQFVPLRPTVNHGMTLSVDEGLLNLPGLGWTYVAPQEIDLFEYIPLGADTAVIVLIAINNDGDTVLTASDNISPLANAFPSGTLVNIPATPNGTAKHICALRIYRQPDGHEQLALQESLTNTDLVDLRLWDTNDSGHTIQNEGSDLGERRYLNFVGNGINVTDDPGNDATVVTLIAVSRMAVFTFTGVLAVTPGTIRIYNKTGFTITVSQVFLSVSLAPTTQAIIVDINKNGTTIFTTQANRPQIAAGANTGFTTTIDVPTLADGDYFTMDIDQVGSGTPGANLTAHVIYS